MILMGHNSLEINILILKLLKINELSSTGRNFTEIRHTKVPFFIIKNQIIYLI